MAVKEEDLLENGDVRERMLNERNTEILDKVKDIVWLGEKNKVSINQVARYYEVGLEAVKSMIKRNGDELKEDGIKVVKKKELKEIKGKVQDEPQLDSLYEELKYTRSLTIFPRRAVLRVGMLLRDSEIAKTVRSYLLNIEEQADEDAKEWAIKREAGKMVRKQFTSSIVRSGENSRMYGHGFSNYTNLAYYIVFGKKASKLYEERNAPDGKLRDYLSEEELNAVREVENTISGLLNVDFEYSQIKQMLHKKFNIDLDNFK